MSKRSLPEEDSKKLVVSSNNLIHAKYSFTLWQKRIFAYMVSEINSFDDREFPLQKMYIRDLMNFFKVKNKDDYNVIERVPEQMYAMSMRLPYRTDKGHKRWGEVRILSKYTRPEDKIDGNAYIELKFNDDLKPHLLELKRLFSQYDIQNIIHLRSVYSFKMYELIKANQYLSKWEVDLPDLKEMLDVEEKYRNYGSFKLRILNAAQIDLTEYCDVTFSYIEKTVGKRVDRLIFYIRKNTPTRGQETSTVDLPASDYEAVQEPSQKDKTSPTAITTDVQEKLITELFPIVVIQFGVGLNAFYQVSCFTY